MTGAGGRRVAILAGTAVLPFRDGIAAAVATPWDVVAVPDDLSTSIELDGGSTSGSSGGSSGLDDGGFDSGTSGKSSTSSGGNAAEIGDLKDI